MGMFRDMKDMVGTLRSDDLKELKRKADAQPKVSMREGVKLANQAVDAAQVWQQQSAQMPGFDPTGGAAMYSSGTPGNATIVAVADTGTFINNAPVMELDLTVSVPGRAPYQVKHRQLVAHSQLPNFQPGRSFPVHVDQSDPTKLVIG